MALTTDGTNAERRRVVVTGIGPVTPVGTGVEEFWTGLLEGRNGVREISRFPTDDLPVKVAGDVHDFDPSAWLDPKEVRAWTIHRGDTAPAAAGVIHTDFERGFIRAETVSYGDFVSNCGWKGAREKGVVRSEGKEYVVNDGDVMLFRFNV